MTTPRTDAIAQDWRGHEDYGSRLDPLCRQLETELIALREEYEKHCVEILSLRQERDQLLATISDMETRHAAVMLHTHAVVGENKRLVKRSVLEKCIPYLEMVAKHGFNFTSSQNVLDCKHALKEANEELQRTKL